MEDVEFAIGPHRGGIAVDNFGEDNFGGGLHGSVLAVTYEGGQSRGK